MKKFFVTFCGVLLALVFISAQAADNNSGFVGNWVNVDTNTKEVDKVIIKPDSYGGLIVNVFAKCSPKDCEWGNVAFNTFSKSMTEKEMTYGLATWKIHHADWPANSAIDVVLTVQKTSDNEIKATIFTTFKDDSGRPNYASNYTFKLQQ